jgi:hypothetical protein
MSEVRRTPCDVRTVPADPNDSDIRIQPPTEPEPTWDVRQARAFGRRGDQRAFEKWLCQQTSDHDTWKMLRREFERSRNEQEPVEAWRKVWREGVVPQLSTEGLGCLLDALKRDDPRIVTGCTTIPPALSSCSDLPIESADPIVWALLDGHSPRACTVGLMDEAFARLAIRCSELCGMPRAIGTLLCWLDEQDRQTWRTELIKEVTAALIGRIPAEAPAHKTTPLAELLRASVATVRKDGAA